MLYYLPIPSCPPRYTHCYVEGYFDFKNAGGDLSIHISSHLLLSSAEKYGLFSAFFITSACALAAIPTMEENSHFISGSDFSEIFPGRHPGQMRISEQSRKTLLQKCPGHFKYYSKHFSCLQFKKGKYMYQKEEI